MSLDSIGSTESIYANIVSNATAYRFYITNTDLGYSYTVDRALRVFQLNTIPGLSDSTTYTVQVAVQIGGVFGPYGSVCHLTTPVSPIAKSEVSVASTENLVGFEMMAVPNPFTNDFRLAITTQSDQPLEITIYDVVGQLLASQKVVVSSLPELALGSEYPSGVYYVTVSQQGQTHTLRMIKR